MTINTLIFDLDGTLVHTAPDLLRATNHVLELNGRKPVVLSDILEAVSYGAREIIKRGFDLTGPRVSENEVDDLFDAFIDYYSVNIAVDSHPFDGVVALLERCRSQDMKLGVCTNKLEGLSRQLLDALSMSEFFSAIVGRDTIGIAKPDAAPYLECVKRVGGSVEGSMMVGDSKTDVLTARAAGVPVVGVTFGYTDEPMEKLGADFVTDSFRKTDFLFANQAD